jgi:hypothetical protein
MEPAFGLGDLDLDRHAGTAADLDQALAEPRWRLGRV